MNTIIQNAVVEAVERQSWFQRNANTIVTGLGALAGLLGFLATLPLPIKDEYRALIPVVAGFLTTFATKFTINGIQPSMIDKLGSTITAQSTLPVDVTSIATEAARMAPASTDLVAAVQAEVARWPGHVQEAVGQAQGVADQAHQLAAEYVGQHRSE